MATGMPEPAEKLSADAFTHAALPPASIWTQKP